MRARARPRRPRLRPRPLLRLDALQDPRAPRPRRLRRALRALRPRVLRPSCRSTPARRAPTGSRSRTATASSSSTRRAGRTRRTSSQEPGARVDLPRRRDHGRRPAARRVSRIAGGTRARRLARTPSPTRGSPLEPRDERPHDLGMPCEDRRRRGSRSTDRRDRRPPTSPGRGSGRSRCTGEPRGALQPCSTRRPPHRPVRGDRVGERRDSRRRNALAPTERRRADGPAQGPIASASIAEQTSTPAAASALRGRRSRATPKTVAAMRKGIDRRDAVIAGIRHRSEVRQRVREELRERHERQPRREHEQEEQRAARARRGRRCRGPRRARRAPRPDP